MIEYLNIFFSSLLIFIFFNGNDIFFNIITKKNIFKKIVISLVISFNIFLFFSFLKNGLNYSIYFIYLFLFLNIFGFIKNLFNYKFIFFLIINFALFLQIASNPILGWDGQAIWYPKAYNFLTGFDFSNLSKFTKPNYPHLGGFIWAIFWKIPFLNYEYLGRFIYIFTFLSSLFFVTSFSENKKLRNILTILILYLVCFDVDLFRGYQEYLIFSFLNIFIVFFYNERNDLLQFFIAILIINIIIWIKNESLIYCLPFFFGKRTAWMFGNTPPAAIVTPPISLFNSSSLRTANWMCLGMIRLFLLSRAALPANSKISAHKYSNTAAMYTGAPAPILAATRPCRK